MAISEFSSALLAQLTAAAPGVTVSFGDETDKTMWQLTFAGGTTPAQQAAAQAVVAGFNVAAAKAAEAARRASFTADAAYIDLINRARTASASDIDTWFANNVTTLSQARAVLAAVIKLLVMRI